MRITTELAYPILLKLRKVIPFNVNIMNDTGTIVASTDPKRMYQEHEGANEVLRTKKQIVIYQSDAELYPGSKPGINLPIEFLDDVIGVVGVTGDPDELFTFVQIIKITVETMIQYIHVHNQLHYQQKMKESWVLELIHPAGIDEQKLESNAKHFLNINTKQEVAIILVELLDISTIQFDIEAWTHFEQIKSEIYENINLFLGKNVLFSAYFEERFLLLGISPKDEMKRISEGIVPYFSKKNLHISIGIGGLNKGIAGYRDSFFEASKCLELNRKFSVEKNISHISDWGILRLIDEIPRKVRKAYLDENSRDGIFLDEELLKTIRVWFESDLRMKETSEKLHIHRNTLLYRLESVKQQTGLDPRNFRDSLSLFMLLIFRDLEV